MRVGPVLIDQVVVELLAEMMYLLLGKSDHSNYLEGSPSASRGRVEPEVDGKEVDVEHTFG